MILCLGAREIIKMMLRVLLLVFVISRGSCQGAGDGSVVVDGEFVSALYQFYLPFPLFKTFTVKIFQAYGVVATSFTKIY